MLTLEGIGVATDQWFGSRADPTSPAASMTMVPAFAALAVVVGTVLAALPAQHRPTPRVPPDGQYTVSARLEGGR